MLKFILRNTIEYNGRLWTFGLQSKHNKWTFCGCEDKLPVDIEELCYVYEYILSVIKIII